MTIAPVTSAPTRDTLAAAVIVAFALILAVIYAFSWLFISLGLSAGNAQAAQALSTLIVVPLSFVLLLGSTHPARIGHTTTYCSASSGARAFSRYRHPGGDPVRPHPLARHRPGDSAGTCPPVVTGLRPHREPREQGQPGDERPLSGARQRPSDRHLHRRVAGGQPWLRVVSSCAVAGSSWPRVWLGRKTSRQWSISA